MSKLVINHLEKVFITSDAATIVGELEVEHPAAKMLTMAAKQQETEVGDGTNFVVTFTGELLGNARDLLRMVRGCRVLCCAWLLRLSCGRGSHAVAARLRQHTRYASLALTPWPCLL